MQKNDSITIPKNDLLFCHLTHYYYLMHITKVKKIPYKMYVQLKRQNDSNSCDYKLMMKVFFMLITIGIIFIILLHLNLEWFTEARVNGFLLKLRNSLTEIQKNFTENMNMLNISGETNGDTGVKLVA